MTYPAISSETKMCQVTFRGTSYTHTYIKYQIKCGLLLKNWDMAVT